MPELFRRRQFLVAAACLGTSAALGADKWPSERTAGRFACHADFVLDREMGLLDELGVLARDVATLLEVPEPKEMIHLFLFDKQATYQAYLKHYFPRVPYRRALYIKGRGPGMVFAYRGVDFEIDVRHECTHAILHASLDNVPLWLDEGLAEYLEMPRDKRANGHPHQAAIEALIKSGQVPRLAELESIDELTSMGRDEYRDAWAWVHFMLHGPADARRELRGYFTALRDESAAEPLSRRLQRQFPDLPRRMAAHFPGR